jgi:hypothetical protein
MRRWDGLVVFSPKATHGRASPACRCQGIEGDAPLYAALGGEAALGRVQRVDELPCRSCTLHQLGRDASLR